MGTRVEQDGERRSVDSLAHTGRRHAGEVRILAIPGRERPPVHRQDRARRVHLHGDPHHQPVELREVRPGIFDLRRVEARRLRHDSLERPARGDMATERPLAVGDRELYRRGVTRRRSLLERGECVAPLFLLGQLHPAQVRGAPSCGSVVRCRRQGRGRGRCVRAGRDGEREHRNDETKPPHSALRIAPVPRPVNDRCAPVQ